MALKQRCFTCINGYIPEHVYHNDYWSADTAFYLQVIQWYENLINLCKKDYHAGKTACSEPPMETHSRVSK